MGRLPPVVYAVPSSLRPLADTYGLPNGGISMKLREVTDFYASPNMC